MAVALSCDAPPVELDHPAPTWTYEPRLPIYNLPPPRGKLGRSQPTQRLAALGVTGKIRVPLRDAQIWQMPGVGPARAAVYGHEGGVAAVELVDVDAGALVWRDTKSCKGPIVGVADGAIACSDGGGVHVLGGDGKLRWETPKLLVAITGEQIVVEDGAALVLAMADGKQVARVVLPPPIRIDQIVASCGAELFAYAGGKLSRIAKVGPRIVVTWSVPIELTAIAATPDACGGDTVLVRGARSLVALARATGKPTGRVDGVRGAWRARDDSDRIEVATAGGIQQWPRNLAGAPTLLPLPPAGELLATRGDRRLVRATPLTAVLLDRDGVFAYLPLAADSAALGGGALLAANPVRRLAIPERARRIVRVPPRPPGVALPAELRDLPDVKPLDVAAAVAKADTGKHAVAAFALDPYDPAQVYAVALEKSPDDTTPAAIARIDLGKRTWLWQRGDGCAAGQPVAVAIAGDIVACASRGVTTTIRATSRDGESRWDCELDGVDTLTGGGNYLLAHAGDRVVVLDAPSGRVRGRIASEDGAAVRAALVTPAGDPTTWLVTFERGHLVARLPQVDLVAVWSLEVGGVVASITPSGDGVLVALDDGDAYRVDVRTSQVTAMPGLGLAWRATAELVTGDTTGGPIPGIPKPVVAPVIRKPVVDRFGRPILAPPQVAGDRTTEPPPIWTPIPPPPPLGDSWQLTLYELTGGLRARNDYALAAPIAAAPRGPTGSPLVVAYGPELREVIVLDPRTGDPLRRISLPGAGFVFGTIVDGSPVAGALLANPLRAVLF